MRTWHLLTGEFPPQHGGVSDYTEGLARALARSGRQVHVWAPAFPGDAPDAADAANAAELEQGLVLHRLAHGYSLRGLAELERGIARVPGLPRLFLQYVPHAFGYRGMNVPLSAWLGSRRSERVWVMFHEVAYPFLEGPLRTNVLAAANHVMASVLVNCADEVFVSTTAWTPRLQVLSLGRRKGICLPIPSNLPTEANPDAVAALRRSLLASGGSVLLGHFGTYGAFVGPLLEALAPRLLLPTSPERRLLLLGRGGPACAQRLGSRHPGLASRMIAPGELSPDELVLHLSACDLLFQPFPDGLTTRRTSLMAGLALGLPVVTNRGFLTESLWDMLAPAAIAENASADALADAAEPLLASEQARAALGRRAAAVYRARFSLERTVEMLAKLEAAEKREAAA